MLEGQAKGQTGDAGRRFHRSANGNGGAGDWGQVWDKHLRRVVKDNKVTVGKDGWLFLDHDSNAFLNQYSGELRLSAEQLEQWRQLLESRVSRMNELGAHYYFMVAPESPSVYSEKLPDTLQISDERTILQLLAHLDSTRSPAKVIYPLEELQAEKPKRPLYPKIDTHWNDYGAFIAYRRLAREIGHDVPLHEVSEEELHFYEEDVLGDLGYKLGVEAAPQTCATYLYAKARKLHDNGVLGNGSLVVLDNPDGPPTSCIFFGDSFSDLLVRLIGQSFGRVIWSWSVTVDDELVREERPDVVISEMSERFLIRVPDDAKGSIRALASDKLSKGKVRPEFPDWDPSPAIPEAVRAPSIETVETIRDYLLSRGRQEDATLVSVVAYAGLSPTEALRLSWRHIVDGTLTVSAVTSDRNQESADPSTSRQRRIPLLGPLADDLAAWRAATGAPRRGYVFPQLCRCNWGRWLRREFRPAVRNAGRSKLAPQALSDAFAALLIEDGVTPSEVAALMGIERDVVVDRYGYLLAATAPGGNAVDASERIRKVRAGRLGPAPPTLIERLSRLRLGALVPRRLPTDWWNPSQWWDPSLPLKVETVESIRVRLLARNDQEAATFVSVMAYAGLRQLEARDLKWREVRDGELRIEIDPNAPEGDRGLPRSIPLLGPLAADLIEWHSACGSPRGGWVFPELRTRDWREWVGKVYRPAARPAERARRFPSHLCQTFWWLLADQGTPLEEAARQMGLDPEEGMDRYGDFFDEPGEQETVSASARIQRVRATLSGGPLPSGSRMRGAKPFPLPRTSPAVREDLSAMQYQPPAPARPLPPAPPPSRARSV